LDDRAESLRALFAPRHVAVIGASRTPGKNGHTVLRNLIAGGFAGKIYPVNPAGGEIEGLACYRTVAEIPETADCAMLIVPAALCVETLMACAAHGIKSAVIGASGFAEDGTALGRQRQADMLAVARAAGMRLIGPNTNGIYNRSANFSLGYNVAHGYTMPLGPVSIVAHSGAVFAGIARTLMEHRCGIAKFVPVGNEADLDMLDVLDYCIEDDDTRVIGLAIEALTSGERFRVLAQKAAARGKAIVALKIGRSAVGIGAALAHSSRLAGGARAYDSLFAACAVANVRSVEALAGACAFLARRTPATRATDRRIVAVSSSGAGGAVLADHAAERGLALAGDTVGAWAADINADVSKLRLRGTIRNPIDLGSLEDVADLDMIYRALERRGLNGPTIAFAHLLPSPDMDRRVLAAFSARLQRTAAPIVVVAPGGLDDALERAYRDAGIFICRETSLAFEVFAAHFATIAPPDAWRGEGAISPAVANAAARLRAARKKQSMLPETDSAEVLRGVGVPMVATHRADTLDQARAAATRTNFPVVLKVIAPGIAHKHADGLVIVSIENAAALEKAHGDLRPRADRISRDLAAIILQQMVRARLELLVGVSREASLGHFFVIGLGGIHAEVFDDVVLLPVALELPALRARIGVGRVGRLLAALDPPGKPLLLEYLMATLTALQDLVMAAEDIIESVELNPMLVTHASDLVAVDALIVFNASGDGQAGA
jgi:acyl-CoA synthetase (NDP forming)